MTDIEIANSIKPQNIVDIAKKLGIKESNLELYGNYKAKINNIKLNPTGKLILVTAIKQLAAEHEIPVIDLYNSNILDTHDAAVIYNYMPDGVHCNPDGYQIMAQHFAAELIKMYEGKQQ